MKKLLNLVLFLTIFYTGSIAEEKKGVLPEAVIKGEEVLKFDSSKPKLELTVEQDKEIIKSLEIEKEIFYMKPQGWEKQPKDCLASTIKSPFVIVPRSHIIRDSKICVFNPYSDLKKIYKVPDIKKAQKIAKWELVVADDAGQTFREYKGQGLPPEEIVFDGRDTNGKVLEVGYSYSTILRYYDVNNKLHTCVGNPFIIYGLAHQESEGFLISLDFARLYKSQPTVLGERSYSELGKMILQETSDIIKTKFYEFPVEVTVFAKDKEIANLTSKEIAKELSKLLIKSEENITNCGKMLEKSLERVEIRIPNH